MECDKKDICWECMKLEWLEKEYKLLAGAMLIFFRRAKDKVTRKHGGKHSVWGNVDD